MPSESRVIGIARDTLETAQAAAADAHPSEYMALLGADPATECGVDREGLLISELLVIPGTQSTTESASIRSHMVPNRDTVGSVHSHPNGVLAPSDADLGAFGRGSVHLILGAPYDDDDWQAFDRRGAPRDLQVFDADLPDPEAFFDFTQADLDAEAAEEGRWG